jgi:DNA processing protein
VNETDDIIEEEYWLALIRAPGIGAARFAGLLKHFEHPRAVFEADKSEWQALKLNDKLISYLEAPNWQAVEKDMLWLDKPQRQLLTLHHADYPPLLREIHNPPCILFIHGDSTLLSSKQVAIVGTRNPSQEGQLIAKDFAEHLSHQGITITSGLALGIDGASHWGALAASGKTIAVAGTGLDRVYPPQHRDLAYKIVETGALISELPIGTPIHRQHFPVRNRIVSGLSLATLVIEVPIKSGALYTVDHAKKQGREIFAVPGSIHNNLVKGCHKLIKQGAKLVDKPADIIEELSISTSKPLVSKPIQPQTSKPPTLKPKITTVPVDTIDDDDIPLSKYLKLGPISIDSLVEQSGLPAGEVSSMLLMLELNGQVVIQAGGLYALSE